MTSNPSFARWLAWGGLAAVAALLVWVLAPVLSPFLVAAVLALLGLFMLLVPVLLKELPVIQQQLPLILERMGAALERLLVQWGLPGVPDFAQIQARLLSYLSDNREDWLKPLLSSLKVGGSAALAVIGHVVLVPVALFFLLKDWTRLSAQVHVLVPPGLAPNTGQSAR